MIPDFDYTLLPDTYVLCLHDACPRAQECLRRAIAEGVPADRTCIRILSPAAARQMAAEGCTYFSPIRKVRYARGLKNVLKQLEQLPYDRAVAAKQAIKGNFATRTYYRVRNGQRPVFPDEQADIEHVFRAFGLEEDPVYDDFIYCYDLR